VLGWGEVAYQLGQVAWENAQRDSGGRVDNSVSSGEAFQRLNLRTCDVTGNQVFFAPLGKGRRLSWGCRWLSKEKSQISHAQSGGEKWGITTSGLCREGKGAGTERGGSSRSRAR